MILVVADTGPVNYLVQTGEMGVLHAMAEKVVLPASVLVELRHPEAPPAVRAWAAAPPEWVEVRAAAGEIGSPDISPADREGISLALELRATVLLMDDQQARRHAARLGVATMGTVGILEAAAERGLLELPAALERLRATSCFLSDEVIEGALRRDAERRGTGRA